MTSSILPPRRLLAPCSPMTQASASTTLDLPEPLGPTMQVMPGSRRMVVAEAKDLKPFRVRLLTYTSGSAPWMLRLRIARHCTGGAVAVPGRAGRHTAGWGPCDGCDASAATLRRTASWADVDAPVFPGVFTST